MAEAKEKKGLTIFFTYKKQFDLLTDEQLGKLMRALIEYAENGTEIDTDDGLLEMAFSFIANNINLARQKSLIYANNGRKGGAPQGNSNAKKIVVETEEKQAKTNKNKQKQAKVETETSKTTKTSHMNKYDMNKYDMNLYEEEEYKEASLQSASASSLSESDLIAEFGADVVSEYKQRVSAWCNKNNRPSKNTLQTVREWIIQDGAGKGTKNEPVVIYSTSSFDVKQIEDDIWAQYD